MTSYAVEATLTVTSQAPQVAIINPAASGVNVELTSIRLVGEQIVSMLVHRHDEELTVTPGQGSAPTVYSFDVEGASCAATVVTKDSHDITEPEDPTFSEIVHDAAGDNRLPLKQPVIAPPGSSITVETASAFEGDGPTITIQVEFREVPAQPVAHIASAQLPAAGAFTGAEYFAIPVEWTGLTFLVSYTAHASSTNARPKWRVSWSDGEDDFIQPIVGSAIDVAALPVASRDQYQLADRWPTGITANATVHFAVPFDRMPGMSRARLDIAELGDTTNRGTTSVSIVGG